jgi:hypothetical protein
LNALGYFVLLCTLAVPIAWLISEFKAERRTRLVLGVVALSMAFVVAWLAGTFQRLNYNAWSGAASKDLVDAIVLKLETGDTNKVLEALKGLQSNYQPTYENRAHYDKLVEETVAKMK